MNNIQGQKESFKIIAIQKIIKQSQQYKNQQFIVKCMLSSSQLLKEDEQILPQNEKFENFKKVEKKVLYHTRKQIDRLFKIPSQKLQALGKVSCKSIIGLLMHFYELPNIEKSAYEAIFNDGFNNGLKKSFKFLKLNDQRQYWRYANFHIERLKQILQKFPQQKEPAKWLFCQLYYNTDDLQTIKQYDAPRGIKEGFLIFQKYLNKFDSEKVQQLKQIRCVLSQKHKNSKRSSNSTVEENFEGQVMERRIKSRLSLSKTKKALSKKRKQQKSQEKDYDQ